MLKWVQIYELFDIKPGFSRNLPLTSLRLIKVGERATEALYLK